MSRPKRGRPQLEVDGASRASDPDTQREAPPQQKKKKVTVAQNAASIDTLSQRVESVDNQLALQTMQLSSIADMLSKMAPPATARIPAATCTQRSETAPGRHHPSRSARVGGRGSEHVPSPIYYYPRGHIAQRRDSEQPAEDSPLHGQCLSYTTGWSIYPMGTTASTTAKDYPADSSKDQRDIHPNPSDGTHQRLG